MSDSQEVHPAEARKQSVGIHTTQDVEHIEAPITWQAYLICAFASFGGIFFGYDSGYINGVNGSPIFYQAVEGVLATKLTDSHTSLITSILSCGTFFGALIAGDVSDWIGRKWTVIIGCGIYMLGVVIQMITSPEHALGPIVAGRLIAGLGVGFESAIVILYMSEIVSLNSTPFGHFWPLTLLHSAPARFVVLSSLVTSSALPLVSCSPLALSTAPRTTTTPVPTVSPLLFSSPGL
jgi:MFS family permease